MSTFNIHKLRMQDVLFRKWCSRLQIIIGFIVVGHSLRSAGKWMNVTKESEKDRFRVLDLQLNRV